MIKITLTEDEKVKLESRHKKCRDKRECDRIKAVLLCSEGWSSKIIAQALRIHEASIVRHLNDFIQSKKLIIIGAIRLGHLGDAVVEEYKTVNGESIIEFLNKTRDFYSSSNTIHMVLDGASYHRSLIVVAAAKALDIELHYLPPYSPNLNPIERFWKVMNKHARNSQYFATAKKFRERIDQFFRNTLPDIADSPDSTINNNLQKLQSAI
jgi:transposase